MGEKKKTEKKREGRGEIRKRGKKEKEERKKGGGKKKEKRRKGKIRRKRIIRRKGTIRRKGSKFESHDLREAFSNLNDSTEKNKGKKKARV